MGRGQHLLVLGQRGRVTIDRRRPGVDHAAHAGVAGGHEQIERCVHAVAVGGCGIGYRARNRGQCRLVKNNLNARADLGADRRIGQIALDELHRLQANQVGRLAGNEAVDATHVPRTVPPRLSRAAAMERPIKPAAPVTRYLGKFVLREKKAMPIDRRPALARILS